jgi:hypothetical protein
VRDSQVLVTPPGDPGNVEYPIELVELDDEAGVWAGAFPGCPDAYGSAGEVIAALTSRPLDDPWVREVVAALDRDREWATRWGAGTGRLRQHLEIVRGRGTRVHATAAANRESIDRHGLDWNRMGLAPGLAGNTRPELPAIFVCEDLDDVSFLLRMAQVPTDIWSVDVDGIWLENAPNGWHVISHPVARERLTLLVRDIPAGGFRADPPEPHSTDCPG